MELVLEGERNINQRHKQDNHLVTYNARNKWELTREYSKRMIL